MVFWGPNGAGAAELLSAELPTVAVAAGLRTVQAFKGDTEIDVNVDVEVDVDIDEQGYRKIYRILSWLFASYNIDLRFRISSCRFSRIWPP